MAVSGFPGILQILLAVNSLHESPPPPHPVFDLIKSDCSNPGDEASRRLWSLPWPALSHSQGRGRHSVSLVPVVHREASGSLGGRVGPEAKGERKERRRDHGWNRAFSHDITT